MHSPLKSWLGPIMWGLAALSEGAETAVPQPVPAERYRHLGEQSPFSLATVAAPAVTPTASFAANWYVSGLARVGATDFVTIKSRDATVQFSLYGEEPNYQHGVTLAGVEWSETAGRNTVMLRHGTETARLEFNEAELRSAPAASAGAAPVARDRIPLPAAPPSLATATNPRPLPGMSTPSPRSLKIAPPPVPLGQPPQGTTQAMMPKAAPRSLGPPVRQLPRGPALRPPVSPAPTRVGR